MSESIKRKSKDSVFSKLFEDKNNILRMYKEMHPEDTDVTVDDIDVKTLETVVLNGQYNDLGFTVKDKFILLIEAQSTWSTNILVRMLLYVSETIRRYLDDTEQSVHQSSKVKLPVPELHVFYSGKESRPKEISLNDEFFKGKSGLDVKVKIFSQINDTIAGQYIGFCRVFDEERQKQNEPIEIAKAIYKICIEKGYLTDFMRMHEKEVIDMMYSLFDEEYARKQYDRAMQREKREELAKIRAESEAKGEARGEAKGRADALKEALANLIANGMSEQQARKMLGM